MKGTVKEITDILNNKGIKISTVHVNGYVKTMEALGKAKPVGEGAKPARGRSPIVYEVEES